MEVNLRLWVSCPRCGRRPLDRISEIERLLHLPLGPNVIAKTHKCRCGCVYYVTAAAYQQAGNPDAYVSR